MYLAVVEDLEMSRHRKTRTFKIDELILDGLNGLARKHNTSANRVVENVLMEVLKREGFLAEDTEPLGETRGGNQKSKDGDE
ncbi:hypothetical protein [Anabaena sp. CCY 9402-a]|uniref:hypothetical protein n=1 Tax=Anabaena sp. CCY 9402-a TaxID=3103867 RepID=UPI0039C745C5